MGGPVQACEQRTHGAHRGRGEPGWLLCMGGMAADHGQRREALSLRGRLAHQHQGGCTVGDGAGIGGGDAAVLGESRFELGDFLDLGLGWLFVLLHHGVTLASRHGHGCGLPVEMAVTDGGLGTGGGGHGVGVLGFAGEAVVARAIFGKSAHEAAPGGGAVVVFQSVEEHVVDHLAVAQALAAARFREQVGGVAHGLHAADDDGLGAAGQQQVVTEHDGFHAGAADLADGGAAGGQGQARTERGLSGGCLAESGRQHASHQHFVDGLRGQAAAGEGGGDGLGAELRCRQAGEAALKPAQRRAGGADDDDGVGGGGEGGGHERLLDEDVTRRPGGRLSTRMSASMSACEGL